MVPGRRRTATASLVLSLAAAACATTRNYPDPSGPRFGGSFSSPDPDPSLRVVTFNIKFSRQVDRAISLFQATPELRDVDMLALQEMDEVGAERIARALGLSFVYYPSSVHPADHKNFGNAILSRWPIVDDRKLVLPHRGRFRKQQRIAVAATVLASDRPIRVYNLHLDTPFSITGSERRDQVRTLLADAGSGYERVIVAGDFNNEGMIAKLLQAHGFTWLTRGLGPTIHSFSWDHVFVRGLRPYPVGPSAGLVRDARGASDHRPVWAVLALD